jgi:hypothetical protein
MPTARPPPIPIPIFSSHPPGPVILRGIPLLAVITFGISKLPLPAEPTLPILPLLSLFVTLALAPGIGEDPTEEASSPSTGLPYI